MKLGLLFSAVALALSTQALASEPHVHWSYSGSESPEHWGDLAADYQTCKLGKQQSPVNIVLDENTKTVTKPLKMDYFPTAFKAENNGHTLQVSVTGKAPSITLGDKVYELRQFHFHTPSEHTFKGEHYPLEIHLVHQSEDKSLAVVAVMVKEGEANPALAEVTAKKLAKGQQEAFAQPLNLSPLFPKDQSRLRLNGSLTTPPCSENVAWIIYQQPITASKAQIAALESMEGHNNRPAQPLNDRKIEVEN